MRKTTTRDREVAAPSSRRRVARSDQPKIEWVLVTPALAAEWLAHSARYGEKTQQRTNRNVSSGHVERLTRDMRTGHWRQTGVPIIRDVHGVVRDGGHRLAAVVKSGESINFVVVTDVEPDAQRVIDKGRRRTVADDLFIRGIPDAPLTAATATLIVHWRGGNVMSTDLAPTAIEVNEFVDAFTDPLMDAVRESRRVTVRLKDATASVMGAGAFASREVDEDASARFYDALMTGENLAKGDPILALRNTIGRYGNFKRKPPRSHQLWQLVHAWNLWRLERSAEFLRVPKSLSSETFPVMK